MGDVRPQSEGPERRPSARAHLVAVPSHPSAPDLRPDVLARRRFAMPHDGTRIGEEQFPHLDPSDPDDRGMLIEGEHPEYHEALADPRSVGVDGVDPRFHIAVHEVVATQLWDDDPPQVWQAARRLLATGAERHDVLHAIADVLVGHLHGVLSGEGDGDFDRYVAELERLGREPSDVARVIPLRRKR